MVIKTVSEMNPFSDYGNIVSGGRFAGRKKEIQLIHQRVLGENSYGNIAVVGMPRIGKSSLVWNALMPFQEVQFREYGNLICFVYVGTFDSSKLLYKKIIYEIIEKLKENSFEGLQYFKDVYCEIASAEDDFLIKNLMQKFFRQLRRRKIRVTIVLDEFDKVSSFFTESDFQLVRELSTQPDTKVCVVTISRRTLQEIEKNNGSISNFSGVFSDLRLGIFDDDDVAEYWKMTETLGVKSTDVYKNEVAYFVGGHPFLMDMFNYTICCTNDGIQREENENLRDELHEKLKLNLENHFSKILELLKNEKLYDKALQLVIGPVYDVKKSDEDKLLAYGFIKQVPAVERAAILCRAEITKGMRDYMAYICFSEYYTEMLNQKYNDVAYWPLWEQTENAVRKIIKQWLGEKFSENWEANFTNFYADDPCKMRAYLRLQEAREVTIAKFKNASPNLIDYTFPRDMFDVFISSDWDWFEKIFGGKYAVWKKIFEFLADFRNPVAHNNTDYLSAVEKDMAQKDCQMILDKIAEWEKIVDN